MIRQNSTPMDYSPSLRPDNASIRTTGRAGEVIPVTAGPLNRGDSASGRIVIEMELAEMPRPLVNIVLARAQVWVVPRPAFPQFNGLDEYTASFHGKSISALGSSDRTPPSLFNTVAWSSTLQNSEIFSKLGIWAPVGKTANLDYVDAYVHILNFRLAAHSSKLSRYDYYQENAVTALELKPAFWPKNRMQDIVPDYETALVTGALDLDVSAGLVPVTGLFGVDDGTNTGKYSIEPDGSRVLDSGIQWQNIKAKSTSNADNSPMGELIVGDMSGVTINTTLADIDKARTTNAMAKELASKQGYDFSGHENENVIIAELMQGFAVPPELQQRPWLVDSKTITFQPTERHATDAANLEDSSTTSIAALSLSVNIPKLEYGGVYMCTVEVMPERLFERMTDPYLLCASRDDLPDALRDIQIIEPVDPVPNYRIDALHSNVDTTHGFEPMNAQWRRDRTSFGGNYRQGVPGTPNVSARKAIWQADYVDPNFTSDHWLCPHPFPQTPFAVPSDDIVTIQVTQTLSINGITQFGDTLVEDNAEFLDVSENL